MNPKLFFPPSSRPCGWLPAALAALLVAGLVPEATAASGPVTFEPAQSFATGSFFDWQPNSVAIGDVNGDGKPDLAVANGATFTGTDAVSVHLGDGDRERAYQRHGFRPFGPIHAGAELALYRGH